MTDTEHSRILGVMIWWVNAMLTSIRCPRCSAIWHSAVYLHSHNFNVTQYCALEEILPLVAILIPRDRQIAGPGWGMSLVVCSSNAYFENIARIENAAKQHSFLSNHFVCPRIPQDEEVLIPRGLSPDRNNWWQVQAFIHYNLTDPFWIIKKGGE